MTLYDHNSNHDRFTELAALATSGALTRAEAEALREHLLACGQCRERYQQYVILARDGFPLLAGSPEHGELARAWNGSATFEKLLGRIEPTEAPSITDLHSGPALAPRIRPRPNRRTIFASGLAAGIAIVAAFSGYYLGISRLPPPRVPAPSRVDVSRDLLEQTRSLNALLAEQATRIAALVANGSAQREQVEKLRNQMEALQSRSNEERAAFGEKLDQQTALRAASELQLRDALLDRDHLSTQLREAMQAYQNVQTELTNLRTEHENAKVRMASLDRQTRDSVELLRDQERRLKDAEQYAVSDVEVRELIGARNLYIADVFDVDSKSRTKKPFGRVFYTRGKSLVFYAFDLDQQRDVKGNSAYQVWGQRETAQGQPPRPLNLGILYLDSEPNRRWLLRFDDAQTLAQIGAIFVTVEPTGGSPKPTGKPFLFAMLRREANHP